MTTQRDLERHLYRALTGNRLGHGSHTLKNAMAAIGKVSAQPWKVAGVSRETWRRWGKGEQKPGAASRAGLLAALRRLRLSPAREARLRQNQLTIKAFNNYDQDNRLLGPTTLQWDGTGPVVDAYLARGIEAAAEAFLDAIGSRHFADWLSPDADKSNQSYDVTALSLDSSPSRGTATRATKRRRR